MVGVDQIDVLVGMIVFFVLLLLAGFGAWAYMRMGDSETRSMRGYHHTIETLEDIGHRTPAGAVRVVRDPNATDGEPDQADRWVGGTGERSVGPPISGTGATAAGVGDSHIFEDTSVRGRLNAPAAPKVQARALTAMNRRPRRLGGPIAVAVIVLAVLAGVIAIGASGSHHSGQPGATTTSTTAAPAGRQSSTTTIAVHVDDRRSRRPPLVDDGAGREEEGGCALDHHDAADEVPRGGLDRDDRDLRAAGQRLRDHIHDGRRRVLGEYRVDNGRHLVESDPPDRHLEGRFGDRSDHRHHRRAECGHDQRRPPARRPARRVPDPLYDHVPPGVTCDPAPSPTRASRRKA